MAAPTARVGREAVGRIALFGRFIALPHSVFALPFAFAGVVFAYHRIQEPPRIETWLWVIVAMVGARTAGMAFNRIADRAIDAANPRTRDRELPRGALRLGTAWGITALGLAVFLLAAWRLNPLCFALTPLALAIVFGYSYTKRFTWGSHLFLGLALAVAPVGGWTAVTGTLDAEPFLLALAVLAWVAGFDIFYAIQDREFDRAAGLKSIPARFGVVGAFRAARILHAVTVVSLALLMPLLELSPAYLAGLAVVAALLVYEHRLIAPHDLRRLDRAFFDVNGLIGAVYFIAALGGALL